MSLPIPIRFEVRDFLPTAQFIGSVSCIGMEAPMINAHEVKRGSGVGVGATVEWHYRGKVEGDLKPTATISHRRSGP